MEEITVQATVNAPVKVVWDYFTGPEHIIKWNNASDDWHTPRATNDLRVGGKFNSRMESRDGKQGFDFEGVYDEVVPQKLTRYTMSDGRKVSNVFEADGDTTRLIVTFDPEKVNDPQFQREGWQAILNSFKKYTESH